MKNTNCLIFFSLILIGCARSTNNLEVEKNIDAFYNEIARINYNGAYNFFQDVFKQKVSNDDFNKLLTQVNNLYGDFKSKEKIGWDVTEQINSNSRFKIYHYRYKVHYTSRDTHEDMIVWDNGNNLGFARYDITPIEK